jgi:hypothetical protein
MDRVGTLTVVHVEAMRFRTVNELGMKPPRSNSGITQ